MVRLLPALFRTTVEVMRKLCPKAFTGLMQPPLDRANRGASDCGYVRQTLFFIFE
jgi:hypothetical protein